MNPQSNIDRIKRQVRDQRVESPPDMATPQAAVDDADQLAGEAVKAFADALERHRRNRRHPDPNESDEKQVAAILAMPPSEVTFYHLEELSRVDPARALERWESLKRTAHDDLVSGRLASFALEHEGGSAWERALFMAIREQLFRAWLPRHAGEAMLLEEMAQYEAIRQKWICIISCWSRDQRIEYSLKNRDNRRKEERTVDAAQANIEAIRMVERLQKLYQNALRMLLDSRRGKSTFIVQRAKQMNVAVGPQMNVTTELNG